MTKSTTHTLNLSAGRFAVNVVEADTGVYLALDGVKPKGCEKGKVRRFLWPIVDAFREDSRPIEISGAPAPWTGHVVTQPGGGFVAYTTRQEVRHG